MALDLSALRRLPSKVARKTLRPISEALFLDLPFLLDKLWRLAEYATNANHFYKSSQENSPATIGPRPLNQVPAFYRLLMMCAFVLFGPTITSLCSVGGEPLLRCLYAALIFSLIGYCIYLVRLAFPETSARIRRRLHDDATGGLRRAVFILALCFCALLAIGSVVGIVMLLLRNVFVDPGALCTSTQFQWLSASQSAAALALFATLYSTARFWPKSSYLFWARWQLAVLVFVGLLHWFILTDSAATEAAQIPYRHIFVLMALALVVGVLGAKLLAAALFRQETARLWAAFSPTLDHAELFRRRGEPNLSVSRVSHALFNALFTKPLQLLLLPALVVVVTADRWLMLATISAAVISIFVRAWSAIDVRWRDGFLDVERWFLRGTPLGVSLVVIVVAGARLAGNQYVTTILSAAPFGTLVVWILMAYTLLWWFEHAINQVIGRRLLAIMRSGDGSRKGYISYPAREVKRSIVRDRYIALHGAGRFVVVGSKRAEDNAKKPFKSTFQTYGYLELLGVLAATGEGKNNAQALEDVQRRVRLYFNVLNTVIVGLLICYVALVGRGDNYYRSTPVVVAKEMTRPTISYDLSKALQQRGATSTPAIVLAASGGGTRAALYTATVLEGLARISLTDDVVLVSGVSGGGVTLARFSTEASHLPKGKYFDAKPWIAFEHKVSEPFIEDVIDGAMEWRIAKDAPLSILLAESFSRRFEDKQPRHLRDVTEMGLILNTTIVGHMPTDSTIVRGLIYEGETKDGRYVACLPSGYLAGSRLSFTNLMQSKSFPSFQTDPTVGDVRLPDVAFPYLLVNDPDIPVMSAAALNANFPPVFPNARVNILSKKPECGGVRSYYVTDGGAVENLGLISALFGLLSALNEWPPNIPPPPLHLIAIEASAVGLDYAQDRGVGTATSDAKERLAGGLTQLLISRLEARLRELNGGGSSKLHVYYLAMPLVLRSRGGLGTHWMLAKNVLVRNPHGASPVGSLARNATAVASVKDQFLTHEELLDLLRMLHKPTGLCPFGADLTESAQTVAHWICDSQSKAPMADVHVEEWRRIIRTLAKDTP